MRIIEIVKYKFVLLIVALSMLGMFSAGCANQVGQDDVPQIANSLRVGMKAMVRETLIMLHDKAPEQLMPVMTDIKLVKSEIDLVISSNVNVGSVVQIMASLFDRMNERFALIQDKDISRVLRSLTDIAEAMQGYFEEYKLPEDIKIYAMALSAGMDQGITEYEQAVSE